MKYFGIANPRIAWNASIPVFWVLFGLVMSIGWKAEVAWLFPITFLAILCVTVITYRKAFCPFLMDTKGIRSPFFKVDWENVSNIELVFTESNSVLNRGAKYKTISVCIGAAVYGDVLSQDVRKCVIFPYSHKSISYLRKLAAGKNRIVDTFLSSCMDIET